jgi:hypothetical protein
MTMDDEGECNQKKKKDNTLQSNFTLVEKVANPSKQSGKEPRKGFTLRGGITTNREDLTLALVQVFRDLEGTTSP